MMITKHFTLLIVYFAHYQYINLNIMTKNIWANFAVKDLKRTSQFYTALGFRANGDGNELLTSFFFGDNNFVIHFFVEKQLETALKGNLADLSQGNEIIFTLGAASRAEVDEWETKVKAAGGQLISNAEEFGEGYYGFVFADPDGHKFNVFNM